MSRLVLLAIAGAAAGLIVFLILNPSYALEESGGLRSHAERTLGEIIAGAMLLGASFAAMLGGLIGGGIGGILFDVISVITSTGSVSRFLEFTIMGAATGAAVALVEEVAKQSWVTIMSGPRQGKSYILSKPMTVIGREKFPYLR